MVSWLRGVFAFVIRDDGKCGLFPARDLYGIKPLYTANDWLDFSLCLTGQGIANGRAHFARSRAGRHCRLSSVRLRS
jgi:hypothetical protein